MTDDEWKQKLTPEQYHVLREMGQEVPGTGKYLRNNESGEYHCVGCDALIFRSDHKYESNIWSLQGWPSFFEAAEKGAVNQRDDYRHGMHRIEISCANCGSHLGHLFPDDSSPNGQHYCINSVCLDFKQA